MISDANLFVIHRAHSINVMGLMKINAYGVIRECI